MTSKKLTFKELILEQLALAESNKDAELGAILTGALYQHSVIVKIVNTKMTSVCPSVASEAFTACNELAEKVEEIRNVEENKRAVSDDASGAV